MRSVLLAGQKFTFLGAYDRWITISDCWVSNSNKIGNGNGEAKLYIGSKKEMLSFYDFDSNEKVKVVMSKNDIIKYLISVKKECFQPTQNYRQLSDLPRLWDQRFKEASQFPELIEFDIQNQDQISGSRGYVKSSDKYYKYLRNISIPLISYIASTKLKDTSSNVIYFWKILVDFNAIKNKVPLVYSYGKNKPASESPCNQPVKKEQTSKGRTGQTKYRERVLEICPVCPITQVHDERLLIASHIKPYAVCEKSEQYDGYNGYMLTPLYDKLFDRGFITFTNDKYLIVSEQLSKKDCERLHLINNTYIQQLPMTDKHKIYLKYHRDHVFNGLTTFD